jgi:hypothetical protein
VAVRRLEGPVVFSRRIRIALRLIISISSNLFTFLGVLNAGEEEKVAWWPVWVVRELTHLWNVAFG